MKRIDESTRVLVTGASGLIGSAIVWALNRRGCTRILACDILDTTEKWRNLVPLQFDDYIEADGLACAMESGKAGPFDVVFHLGACSATTERDAGFLIRNNYKATQWLCAHALESGARFVYASSAATYGDGSRGMQDTVHELHALRPLNMYGYSKHLFDLHAMRAGFLDRIAGVKYFNVFGPNEAHKGEMRSVVAKAFDQIRATGEISLFKSHRPDCRDGEQMRDFLYVKDAAEMTLHLAESPQAGGLFNVGSGVAHTWLDLARAIFAAMEVKESIRFVEMPENLREKYQYHTRADISKLRASGYSAEVTPLAGAVADYVRNFLAPDLRLGDGEV